MFKKTTNEPQLGLFSNPSLLLSGRSERFYEKQDAWHNLFRNQVTSRIDEAICKPLFTEQTGSPNSSVRVLISMMVLKEANGWSDAQLFEQCRFNLLVRSALGLLNMDDTVPTESTYYLFRKNINDHAKRENENLFDTIFADITKQQSLEFNVSGKRIRMDSKLLGSNIAWLSRYELVHETLRLFYREVKKTGAIGGKLGERLDELLKFKGNKVVYTSTSDEVKTKLQKLGELIYEVLLLFRLSKSTHYTTLERVFAEQFSIDEAKLVITRNKEDISAKSIQSPHDTDCHFRNKDGNKVKGYSVNVTESCDDQGLNLIGDVDVREVSTSDVDFFQEDIQKTATIFTDLAEDIHADGAYHSPDNQEFCSKNNADLHLHAIQGAKGRYQLELSENGNLTVLDTKTNEFIETTKIKGKNKVDKWRIKVEKGYRYFTHKEIDTSRIRKKIEQTPIEILQKRNNVEATIFQLGYHYPNAKSRYRGLVKHQMWANMRCLWVNFVRVLNFVTKIGKKYIFFGKHAFMHLFDKLIFNLTAFMQRIICDNLSFVINFKFITF